jgi:hypothetical protein
MTMDRNMSGMMAAGLPKTDNDTRLCRRLYAEWRTKKSQIVNKVINRTVGGVEVTATLPR